MKKRFGGGSVYGGALSNAPLDSLWDFHASPKHGPSRLLGRSGQKLTPGRRVHARVILLTTNVR